MFPHLKNLVVLSLAVSLLAALLNLLLSGSKKWFVVEIGGLALAMAGIHFLTGFAGPLDNAHAARLYRWLCYLGNAATCSNLGVMYENGEGGLSKDLARAVQLYNQACDGGDAQGCRNLAVSYWIGEGGLPKDPLRAVQLLRKGCDGGSAAGCTHLGAASISWTVFVV